MLGDNINRRFEIFTNSVEIYAPHNLREFSAMLANAVALFLFAKEMSFAFFTFAIKRLTAVTNASILFVRAEKMATALGTF